MHTKEILIVLHTLFLQHVLLSKVNAPHEKYLHRELVVLVLSDSESKEFPLPTITLPFGAFSGVLLLTSDSLCSLLTVFAGTGKLFLMCVKVV